MPTASQYLETAQLRLVSHEGIEHSRAPICPEHTLVQRCSEEYRHPAMRNKTFEHDATLGGEPGQHLCTGFIRCYDSSRDVIKTLTTLHGKKPDFVTDAEMLGALDEKDVCTARHLYCKKVRFEVRLLEDNMNIT